MRTVFIFLLCYPFWCYSQIEPMEDVKLMLQSGKDSIVQRAMGIVGIGIDIEKLNVKVFTNNKEINVRLQAPFRYVPYNSKAYYEVSILILSKLVSYQAIANPADYKKDTEIKFYVPFEKDLENIRFVAVSALESYDDDIFNLPDGVTITIYEKTDHYQIESLSQHQESYYKVSKSSGIVYDAEHATLIPEPEEDTNEFVEILFDQKMSNEPINIDLLIQSKSSDTLQQLMLINFWEQFSYEDELMVDEFEHHYSITVRHPPNDGYTGGAECYKLNKSTGKAEMEWHESPMPLPGKY